MGRLNSLEARQVEAKAEEVAAGQNVLPICPFQIADAHDIHVTAKDSAEPGVSGFLMRVGDRFGICYASHIQNEGFIRFSVAHELGHYFLDGHVEAIFPGDQLIHVSKFIPNDRYERQADQFAASLLMPARLFRAAVNEAGAGFPAIETLSRRCKTSIVATAIRYCQFTDDPVAVVVSSGRQIDYCFISESLKSVPGVRFIAKHSSLPTRCHTTEFNRSPDKIKRSEKGGAWTSLDEWFDEAPEIEMKEDIVGLGSYGKTLTVLFTDEIIHDEEENEDID